MSPKSRTFAALRDALLPGELCLNAKLKEPNYA
jgi:hypothetical protein